ncbi:hypothetical protein DFH29DRAFT_997561 [Suillus ampliporus]|nr:hypothetical protein DFH29DRAFT_997561 [Suillus ampliporus]
MAHLRRLGRRPLKHYQSTAKQLEVLAIAQLATAEDDDDELLGLALAGLAADYRWKSRSKKYGMRGEYNQPKSKDFFDILLGQASERQFKAWFRESNGGSFSLLKWQAGVFLGVLALLMAVISDWKTNQQRTGSHIGVARSFMQYVSALFLNTVE